MSVITRSKNRPPRSGPPRSIPVVRVRRSAPVPPPVPPPVPAVGGGHTARLVVLVAAAIAAVVTGAFLLRARRHEPGHRADDYSGDIPFEPSAADTAAGRARRDADALAETARRTAEAGATLRDEGRVVGVDDRSATPLTTMPRTPEPDLPSGVERPEPAGETAAEPDVRPQPGPDRGPGLEPGPIRGPL